MVLILNPLNQGSSSDSKLDPKVREKLLKESKNPLLGVRRILWVILFAYASLGLLIMLSRVTSGEVVPFSDIGIQITAFLVFGGLTWFDRTKGEDS